MNGPGKIQVITGEGKGKTTAALGLAWRAIGRGFTVFMVQFMKSPDSSGEHFAAKAFEGKMTIRPMGRKGFITRDGGKAADRDMAREALKEARSAMLSGTYDMIILDEINYAIHFELVDLEDVLQLMEERPENVELVLTGRYAHPQIVERADQVMEIKKIKHPFDEGAPAREGIEY